MQPTSVVALNRAVAVALADGPERGLVLLDELSGELESYHLYRSARAGLLRRSGRLKDAVRAYSEALALTENSVEREYLESRLREVSR